MRSDYLFIRRRYGFYAVLQKNHTCRCTDRFDFISGIQFILQLGLSADIGVESIYKEICLCSLF